MHVHKALIGAMTALLLTALCWSSTAFASISVEVFNKGVRIDSEGVKVIDDDYHDGHWVDIDVFGEDEYSEGASFSLCSAVENEHVLVLTVEELSDDETYTTVRQITFEPYAVGKDAEGRNVLVGVQKQLLTTFVRDDSGDTPEPDGSGFTEDELTSIPLDSLSSVHRVDNKRFRADPETAAAARDSLEVVQCRAFPYVE